MSESNNTREPATLSPQDASALDAILEEPGAPRAQPGDARAARVEEWLKVLGASPSPEPRGDLVQRTLLAIQEDRMKIAPAADAAERALEKQIRRRWTRRLAEFAAMGIAAVLLLAVALQGLDTAKKSSARVACQTNLKNLGMAFGSYSIIYFGELPSVAMPSNRSWLHGDPATGARNNAANLLPLINGGQIALADLFCAGAGAPTGPIAVAKNDLPEISYSYRNLYGAARPQWDGRADTIVLADRNPLLVNPSAGPAVANRNSPNHDGHGTYVLRADASATWETSPNIGPDHDNIWTIGTGNERLTAYAGTEVPDSIKDVFLCP